MSQVPITRSTSDFNSRHSKRPVFYSFNCTRDSFCLLIENICTAKYHKMLEILDILFKLPGHPHFESNFAEDLYNGTPQPAHMYMPALKCLLYSPVPGASVPFCLRILNCSGLSRALHFETFNATKIKDTS